MIALIYLFALGACATAAVPHSAQTQSQFRLVIFIGSHKSTAPPWESQEGDPRLGSRVKLFAEAWLKEKRPNWVVDVLDARDLNLPVVAAPQFFFKATEAPHNLDNLSARVGAADGFLVISAEYNHAIPAGLSSLMSYFGSSKYAFKPSGIVTYSPGEFGGVRAAMALRPFLSELGALPVSAICAIPSANKVLSPDGIAADESVAKRFERLIVQLDFWMEAAKVQRAKEKK